MTKIEFIGYSASHPEDFEYEAPVDGCFLFLLVTSPAAFLINGSFLEYPANTAVLFPPGATVHYRACGREYCNDWIRFRSDEPFVTHFPNMAAPFPVSDVEYCHSLVKLLTWEASFPSPNSERILSHLLTVLFEKLGEDFSRQPCSPYDSRLRLLRKQIYNTPQADWSVASMARQLHLSSGYLQALYKSLFGVSCMQDVIDCRIRLAKEELIYTPHTVREIAKTCGYQNTEHFCRQFRKSTGCTPTQFRRTAVP